MKRPPFTLCSFAGMFLLASPAPVVGQEGGGRATGRPDPESRIAGWLEDMTAADPVVREIARRRLAVTPRPPVAGLAALLAHDDVDVVAAAAGILMDRKLAIDKVRRLATSRHPKLLRIVLPIAPSAVARKILAASTDADGSAKSDLGARALYALEDRSQLTDAQLVAAMRSANADLADAACRLVVLQRTPFPIQIAQDVLEEPAARRRLLEYLAERPRHRAGAFLERILAMKDVSKMDRMLVLNGLPSERIDYKLADEILAAASGDDVAVSNRAGMAAARLLPSVADKLVPRIGVLAQGGQTIGPLFPCIERISTDGERLLLEQALTMSNEVRAEVFHWLSSRESKLVDTYVAKALDGKRVFPRELVRLTSRSLTTKARIARVAELLGAVPEVAVQAFDAMIEAQVYHPMMLAFAMQEGFTQERRISRLLKLPLAKLPSAIFAKVFDRSDLTICSYAVNSLARGPIPKALEPSVIAFAEQTSHEQLRVSAARALILWGSEAGGRKGFDAVRRGTHHALAIRWLMERPKPWFYEALLKERERLQNSKSKEERPTFHRVLIALAKLGDRGANDQLVKEIPKLAPEEMRQVQTLMGRFLKKADLERLAAKYLEVRPADPNEGADLLIDADRRVDLLEWFMAQKSIDLVPMLTELWKKDESYDIRLVALRGLLATGSEDLHAKLLREFRSPYDDDRQELAFEVIGSMAQPITEKGLQLLAHIVLRAPLTDPKREIGLSLRKGYDGSRGVFPLLTPAANLLRSDETARPRKSFAAVAKGLGSMRYALNRQRLGLFLAGIYRSETLVDELGATLASLILAAPDLREDFVGVAEMLLGDAAESAGEFARAAKHFRAAHLAFIRVDVPLHVQRAFLGAADPLSGYHPAAALAARSWICHARAKLAAGERAAARKTLLRASDLAEGDAETLREIATLRKTIER